MFALNHTSLLIKSYSLGLLVGSNSSRLFITREESAVTRDTCGCGNDTFWMILKMGNAVTQNV